jgi:glycosyltransferase involved in cell wall biosynthesis
LIIHAHGDERGRLLSWPRPYPQNPYLPRLAEALARRGIATVSHRYLAVLAARPRGARWLHLHWPEWMLRDASRVRARGRAAWLFGLLDLVRARGVRLAWTAHNLLGHDEPHRDLALSGRRALLERCDVVFGHFAGAERDVRALGFRGRFAVAPHPGYAGDYPLCEDRAAARASLGYGPGERVLLAFGAIETYKGLDRLAAAFVRVAGPRDRLHVAGAPSSRRALADLECAAAGDARVRIEARFAPVDHAARLFAAADAAVLAYREFYTSGTAMLALTCGTPVVGPPEHHLAEFQGQPFFVPMATPEALGDALGAVGALTQEARVAARAYAAARTWDAAAGVVAETLFGNGVAT